MTPFRKLANMLFFLPALSGFDAAASSLYRCLGLLVPELLVSDRGGVMRSILCPDGAASRALLELSRRSSSVLACVRCGVVEAYCSDEKLLEVGRIGVTCGDGLYRAAVE